MGEGGGEGDGGKAESSNMLCLVLLCSTSGGMDTTSKHMTCVVCGGEGRGGAAAADGSDLLFLVSKLLICVCVGWGGVG